MLAELDKKINDLAEELRLKEKELLEIEAKLKNLGSSLTTEEALAEISQVRKKFVFKANKR